MNAKHKSFFLTAVLWISLSIMNVGPSLYAMNQPTIDDGGGGGFVVPVSISSEALEALMAAELEKYALENGINVSDIDETIRNEISRKVEKSFKAAYQPETGKAGG
jgi:hypothetical protein